MKLSILAALVAAVMSSAVLAKDDECNRSPRTVVYNNSPVDVFISNDKQRAEVTFPESYLEGIYVETPGVQFYRTPNNSKLAFYSEDAMFTGLVTVDGPSKNSYIVRLITRPGCADSQVTIQNQPLADRSQANRDGHGNVKGLMNYLYEGKVPSGYRQQDFSKLTTADRVVFRQGSLEFRLDSQLVGPTYIGTTYEIVNKGRAATKVAIDQIDYSNKALRESLGVARQVSMLPSSRILGPSPEFITEVYGETHRGLLFIVSEKAK